MLVDGRCPKCGAIGQVGDRVPEVPLSAEDQRDLQINHRQGCPMNEDIKEAGLVAFQVQVGREPKVKVRHGAGRTRSRFCVPAGQDEGLMANSLAPEGLVRVDPIRFVKVSSAIHPTAGRASPSRCGHSSASSWRSCSAKPAVGAGTPVRCGACRGRMGREVPGGPGPPHDIRDGRGLPRRVRVRGQRRGDLPWGRFYIHLVRKAPCSHSTVLSVPTGRLGEGAWAS
jgi:hypothetical protein